ncbi:MAG: hypothetical protein JWM85_3429 [Acidimicrobiaceae bacterium]|nr:hypothetical protein [Acidimicrobiaceae bacterium]
MRERAALFHLDVVRLGPLLAVVLAVVVNLPSLIGALDGRVTVVTALFRLAVALGLSLAAVSLVSRLLLRYTRDAISKPPAVGEKIEGNRR